MTLTTEQAIKELNDMLAFEIDEFGEVPETEEAVYMAINALKERKIGRWRVEENPTAGRCLQKVYICDICGSAVGCRYFIRRSFCPNCGAKMEVDEC